MRFETKFEGWLVVVLTVAAFATCVALPTVRFLRPGYHPTPLWVVFVPWAVWLLVVPNMLPQYYEIRESGLFLRQGWKKTLLPYASLVELKSVSDAHSSIVFSTDRIVLATRDGQRFVIAVAEDERFLAELSKRCPHLVRTPAGLGISLARP